MTAVNFNQPVTTDLYTAWPTELQANQQSLGFMLDPTYVTGYTGLLAGMKRLSSSSGLFEQWSGTAWAAATVGYTLKAGDTMTGNLVFSGSASLGIGGTPSKPLHVQRASANAAVRISSVGGGGRDWDITSTTTGVLDFTSDLLASQLQLQAGVLTIGSSGKLVTTNAGGESYRVVGSGSYISFWNSANTTRGGYLQGNSGSDLSLVSENGANLLFGTASTIRTVMDASGNLAFNNTTAPPPWASGYRAINLTGFACIAGGTSQDSMELLSNCYAYGANAYKYLDTGPYPAAKYIVGNGQHNWMVAPSGSAGGVVTFATGMTLDGSGNLSAAGNLAAKGNTLTMGSLGTNGVLAVDSSNNAYLRGVTITFQNVAGTQTFLSVSALGQLNVAGSAATARFAIGSQATLTVDWSKSNYQTMTLTGNVAAGGWVFTNMLDGQTLTLKITQDGTGSRTIAANTAVKWPGGTLGVLSTAPGAVDLLVLTYDGATGFFYATLAKGFA